eukprot:TRINITY_DN7496_c0_g1_i1.p1 TRINITY_DN7496_c0_g1~~TRINITY_DN7496_c0_g1_i1.p1  ORF type:complete len:113 (-),score=37.57 TRINITY_DN7496_c0_g1_i1:84-422(-)
MATAIQKAIVYSALILHDDGIEITADKLQSLCKAAGVTVEPIWTTIFAKALAGRDIGEMISNIGTVGSMAAAPAAGGAATAAGGAAAAEEKKEEEKEEEEESDEDMGFGLFD